MKLYRPVKWSRNIDRRLTQQYGVNAEYYKTIWRPYHLGLDYAWPNKWDKVNIYSAESGLVVFAWRDTSGFGNLIKIKGESGSTYYAHLSEIWVKVGDKVWANSVIGIMWDTGNSTWVHLHFGWKPADNKLDDYKLRWDPTPYISNWDIKPISNEVSEAIKCNWILRNYTDSQELRNQLHQTNEMIRSIYK